MLRITLRDPAGRDRDLGRVADPCNVPTEVMLVLSRLPRLDAGYLLVVDDDETGPHREPEPQTLVTLSVGNLTSLAGRLEARARALAGKHPENAADMLMAARFTRHAVKMGWVITSVAVAA